jgi:hypothetical protein
MGQLRFRVFNAQAYDTNIWQTAFVSGLEGIPWASRNRLDGDTLTIDRTVTESGKLSVVWPTEALPKRALRFAVGVSSRNDPSHPRSSARLATDRIACA